MNNYPKHLKPGMCVDMTGIPVGSDREKKILHAFVGAGAKIIDWREGGCGAKYVIDEMWYRYFGWSDDSRNSGTHFSHSPKKQIVSEHFVLTGRDKHEMEDVVKYGILEALKTLTEGYDILINITIEDKRTKL